MDEKTKLDQTDKEKELLNSLENQEEKDEILDEDASLTTKKKKKKKKARDSSKLKAGDEELIIY